MKEDTWVILDDKIGLRQELFGLDQSNSLEQANTKEKK